jgi:hypothetical protein
MALTEPEFPEAPEIAMCAFERYDTVRYHVGNGNGGIMDDI